MLRFGPPYYDNQSDDPYDIHIGLHFKNITLVAMDPYNDNCVVTYGGYETRVCTMQVASHNSICVEHISLGLLHLRLNTSIFSIDGYQAIITRILALPKIENVYA